MKRRIMVINAIKHQTLNVELECPIKKKRQK